MIASEATSAGPMQVGSTFRDTYRVNSDHKIVAKGEALAHDPPNYMQVRMVYEGLITVAAYHLPPAVQDNVTRLDYASETVYNGGQIQKLMAPIVSIIARHQLKSDLEKLKTLTEARPYCIVGAAQTGRVALSCAIITRDLAPSE